METTIVSVWNKSKVLVKGLLISALVLLLLIPSFFVKELITEREQRQREAFTEISSKWAGNQNIEGPMLVLPYRQVSLGSNGQPSMTKSNAYILPDKLQIESVVTPEERHRGIFQVMLYAATVKLSGQFNDIPLQQLGIEPENVLWEEAYVSIGIADSRGLKDEVHLKWNDTELALNPAANNTPVKNAFVAPVTISPGAPIRFSTAINLNGSGQLLFTPVGKETSVRLSSAWPDPSFTGGQLPDHQVTADGFTANWKSLAHTRNFPQYWKEGVFNLRDASFGADFFIPVNGYQKTMRSVKYAILCIVLTFAAFFIIENTNKRSVHPFQYALIGLALILFYTLLLSFSEYTGFNTAYIIATIATVGLISWFVTGILQSSKLTIILGIVLALMYSYVFTILQLQDYSLILGSIGLFLTLGVVMHFSKKIQW